MGKRWDALGRSSGQVNVLIAAFAILVAFFAPSLAKTLFKPTITISVMRAESSIPPETAAWAQGAASFLNEYVPATNYPSIQKRYRLLMETPEAAQLEQYRSANDFGYLYMEITNNSSESASNLAIQVVELERAWRVQYSGSSMPIQEAVRLEQATSFQSSDSVALPIIPVVHPHEVVRLRIYGEPHFATVTGSAENGSVKISEYHLDDDAFWFWWARWMYKLPALIVFALFLCVIVNLVGVEITLGYPRSTKPREARETAD